MKNCTQTSILTTLLSIAHLIPDIIPGNIGFSIVDTQKCLFYHPGKVALPLKVGDEMKPNMLVSKCMSENRRIVAEVGPEVFGTPYIAVATPILDDYGNALGAVCVVESTEKKYQLTQASDQLCTAMSETIAAIKSITGEAERLANSGDLLRSSADTTVSSIGKTETVIQVIKRVSDQTNLLGLNAAIEAARVGPQGKGFGVVASEIRKLASESLSHVKDIGQVLQNINQNINHFSQISYQISDISNVQAASIQQLQAMSEEMYQVGLNLKNLADSFAND